MLVVFIFLKSWRSTVITGLALPVSVLASFIAVLAFGFTLNTMSLLGLSLAIGILDRRRDRRAREHRPPHGDGQGPLHAPPREGTSEIGLAVAATTFSIVVVFVPVAFMGGIAAAVVRAVRADDRVLGDGVAVRVVLARPDAVGGVGGPASRASRPSARGSRASSTLRPRCSTRLTGLLQDASIGWALRHRFLMVVLAIVAFFGALATPGDRRRSAAAFFPIRTAREFIITLETPPGASLEYTQRKVIAARRARAQAHGGACTRTRRSAARPAPITAQIYVRLTPKKARARPPGRRRAGAAQRDPPARRRDRVHLDGGFGERHARSRSS